MIEQRSIYRPYYLRITWGAALLFLVDALLHRYSFWRSILAETLFGIFGLVLLVVVLERCLAILFLGVPTLNEPCTVGERLALCFPAVLMVVVGLVVAEPNFHGPRTSKKTACLVNLKELDGAMQQFALDHHLPRESTVTMDDLKEYLRDRKIPKCPMGGQYHVGPVTNFPTCTIPGHTLD